MGYTLPMVLVLYAHPYPDRSRANRALVRGLDGLEGVRVRSLYDLYPDFHVDVKAEQAAVEAAHTIVLQHPLYWYAPPAIVAIWFEKVLLHGWAFGDGAHALRGKPFQWVVTTGSPEGAYAEGGTHQLPVETFAASVRATALLCGAEWLPPLFVHAARTMPRAALDVLASEHRTRIAKLAERALPIEVARG